MLGGTTYEKSLKYANKHNPTFVPALTYILFY